ncbi:putative Phosphatidate cytidylyltransferase [Blattamonas nauphoetae]|uniref:Phosphatidate cytidylyltransferase n=1 Tax=Blattamonas nauphoetae TaxID=2049346 RepID=A0ABQ9Y6H2_9EUKA|nr:putative Phosphatidate cytidylyltransferase [Blattamonas nauphoetae]
MAPKLPSKINKPVTEDRPTNWFGRIVTSIIIGPVLVLSSALYRPLFIVLTLGVTGVANHEFHNLIKILFTGSAKKSHSLTVINQICATQISLTACLTASLEYTTFSFLGCFLFLVIYHLVYTSVKEKDNIHIDNFLHIGGCLIGWVWIVMGLGILNILQKTHPCLSSLAIDCVVCADTFAMLIGRPLGKHKISPIISPKKSWEGLIGGTVIGALFNTGLMMFLRIWLHHIPQYEPLNLFLVSLSGCFIEQFGDLLQSYLKRIGRVKDSGTAIPGHGGFLDRICGVLFVAPLFYFLTRTGVLPPETHIIPR